MKKKSTDPPRSRPYAPQFVPLDYQGENPKLSQSDIIKQAKREGEILKAHGVTMSATKAEQFQAKKTIDPPPVKEQAPANQAQAPTPAPTTPTPAAAQVQQKQSYQFSEKAKAFFAKFHSKTKQQQPQKEQEQTSPKPKTKPRER